MLEFSKTNCTLSLYSYLLQSTVTYQNGKVDTISEGCLILIRSLSAISIQDTSYQLVTLGKTLVRLGFSLALDLESLIFSLPQISRRIFPLNPRLYGV